MRWCLKSVLSPTGTCGSWKSTSLLFVSGKFRRKRRSGKLNLAKGSTGQSKDMGPTCKQVVALIGNILEQVMSMSFADWVSCTNMDWLRSHRAEKRRQDSASHGRPHSSRESSLEQDAASCTITPRVKDNTQLGPIETGNRRKRAPRHARRQKGEEAKRRPSHIDLVCLRERTRCNTSGEINRNRQLKCNKGKCLSTSKRSKFDSNSVSSIFNAEDL